MEEELKILEEFKKNGYSMLVMKYGDRNKANLKLENALENLIKRYKELEKEIDMYKNKVHYVECEECGKEVRTKRSDTKFCEDCRKIKSKNWYSNISQEKRKERAEKSKLSMKRLRERRKIESEENK